MSFLRPLTINFSVHSRKFLLLRTGRSACCVSLYLSLWHLPWNISPQNKNRWSLYLKSPTRTEHEMSKIPINCFLFLKTRASQHLKQSSNCPQCQRRERDLQERCLWPSGFAKSIAAMSNRPATWSLPLSPSHLMNGAIGRRPAAAKVQSVSSQCKLRLLPRLICTSYPTARHNNSATQCNNSSVAGKGIWVTGFLWLAQFATKLSLIGSSPLLSRIKTRIDKGKD